MLFCHYWMIYSDLDKQSAKKRQNAISEIIQIINRLSGTEENILMMLRI